MSLRRFAGLLIVSLAPILAACDDFKATGIGVGLLAPSPSVRASLLPPTLGFTSVPGFRCPGIAPFLSPLSLFIDQRGGTDIFLDQITFQFGDRSGRRSALQLTGHDLTGMFGTTLVPAGAEILMPSLLRPPFLGPKFEMILPFTGQE